MNCSMLVKLDIIFKKFSCIFIISLSNIVRMWNSNMMKLNINKTKLKTVNFQLAFTKIINAA